MFPSLNPTLELQLQNMNTKEEIKKLGRSIAFDFDKKQFVFKDGKAVETAEIESLEYWIKLCLQTYKDKFNVYKDTGFGVNTEDIVNKKLDAFYISELQREIIEGLKKSRYIKDVTRINLSQEKRILTIHVIVKLHDNSIIEVVI